MHTDPERSILFRVIYRNKAFIHIGSKYLLLKITELSCTILEPKLFKMNIGMLRSFCKGWGWCFRWSVLPCDSHYLYSVIHLRSPLFSILNTQWISKNRKECWVRHLHCLDYMTVIYTEHFHSVSIIRGFCLRPGGSRPISQMAYVLFFNT